MISVFGNLGGFPWEKRFSALRSRCLTRRLILGTDFVYVWSTQIVLLCVSPRHLPWTSQRLSALTNSQHLQHCLCKIRFSPLALFWISPYISRFRESPNNLNSSSHSCTTLKELAVNTSRRLCTIQPSIKQRSVRPAPR